MEARAGKERSASDLLQNAVYGDEALEAYFEEHEGNLVQSPKSMLGYNLHPRAKQTITGIAAHILEHIRLTASAQLGQPLRAALLGARCSSAVRSARPATTRRWTSCAKPPPRPASTRSISSRNRRGGHALPRRKPRAAPGGDRRHRRRYHRHRPCRSRRRRRPRIHRAWGIARGGTDIDLALSLSSYMPLFGRGITRVPAHHYVEAATVQDMTRQRDFRLHKYDHVDAPWGDRLQALQDTGNTARLYRDVERAKIASAPPASTAARWTTSPATCMPTAAPTAWPPPPMATWSRSANCWPRSAATSAATRMRCS
jgi:hypothetical chaperone protein